MSEDHERYPIGGRMSDIVHGLGQRFGLRSLTGRYNSVTVLGLFSFVNGLISIALMSFVALATGQPFVFPSLGPTAFLIFYTPLQPTACPRNTICGHLIGAVAGYLSLVVFGLVDAGPALAVGVTWARVGAAALSLALTSGVMVWLRVPHPPAGATTLIVSLGLITTIPDILVLMLGVVLLVVQGFAINRLAGVPYPVWAPRPATT
ncbi:MAG TPA: HPP family protein [Actinomycetota bacterium]